ncbi:uncharacterized protein LOC105194872 [Solenopsis invicta]|uniref:uncharacterized protein LOC105194872 n=1 Tax=Solenopsis invicta TaxID=13686 RepID=UPI00059633F0|nr:uncharacterized protein LOC105194872 [Solenopsis invicta]
MPHNTPKTLYVGNLDHAVSEDLLCALFSHIGSVRSCKIIREIPIPLVLYAHPIKDLTHNRRIRTAQRDTQRHRCIQRHQIARMTFEIYICHEILYVEGSVKLTFTEKVPLGTYLT